MIKRALKPLEKLEPGTLNRIYRRAIQSEDLINRTIHKNRVVAFVSSKAQ